MNVTATRRRKHDVIGVNRLHQWLIKMPDTVTIELCARLGVSHGRVAHDCHDITEFRVGMRHLCLHLVRLLHARVNLTGLIKSTQNTLSYS